MQTMSSCSLFCEEKGIVLPLNEFATQSIPFENEQELLFLNQNNDELLADIFSIDSFESDVQEVKSCSKVFGKVISYQMKIESIGYFFRINIVQSVSNENRVFVFSNNSNASIFSNNLMLELKKI